MSDPGLTPERTYLPVWLHPARTCPRASTRGGTFATVSSMANIVHGRLRIGGTLYNDASWSIGVNVGTSIGGDPFSGGTEDVQGALQNWADNVKTLNAGRIFPGDMAGSLSTAGTIEFIRASRIGTDGKESAVALITIAPGIKGGGTPIHPAQTAITISLLTGRPGASYRGRLYLPALGQPLTDGRVAQNGAGILATQAAGWLKQVSDAAEGMNSIVLQGELRPIVVSSSKVSQSPITSVRVGNRLDSQRRRAEGQQEVYSVAPVPQ